MSFSDRCPLTNEPGKVVRIRTQEELADSYRTYLGSPLPKHIVDKYFRSSIAEYVSTGSGLRWYSPAILGDGDYYSTLAQIYPWYYNPGSWDKNRALDILLQENASSVLEVGCGSGELLRRLGENKIDAQGIEINTQEVERARSERLRVYLPEESRSGDLRAEWLCMLQTVEHLADPLETMKGYIAQFHPRALLLSAPCFESLLGYTTDPLSWPPHHATAWSERAFQVLGQALGFKVIQTEYSPLSFREYRGRERQEVGGKIPGIPAFARGEIGACGFFMARWLGCEWASRGHSILVAMIRDTEESHE